jgi:hypothetical protein
LAPYLKGRTNSLALIADTLSSHSHYTLMSCRLGFMKYNAEVVGTKNCAEVHANQKVQKAQQIKKRKKKAKVMLRSRSITLTPFALSKAGTIVTKNTMSTLHANKKKGSSMCVSKRLDRDNGFRDKEKGKYPRSNDNQKPK